MMLRTLKWIYELGYAHGIKKGRERERRKIQEEKNLLAFKEAVKREGQE